jgi:anti-anti-sigma factor
MAEYEVEERGEILVVRLGGSLDAYLRDWTPEIESRLRAGPRHLVINMSGIEFIGSRGMGMLFHLHRVLRDLGRKLVVAEPSAPARDALGVGGIASLLEVRDSEEEAVRGLRAAKGKPARARGKGRTPRKGSPASKPGKPRPGGRGRRAGR